MGDLDEMKTTPLDEAPLDQAEADKKKTRRKRYGTFRPFTKPLLPLPQVVD